MTFGITRHSSCEDVVEHCQRLSLQFGSDALGINDAVNDSYHSAVRLYEDRIRSLGDFERPGHLDELAYLLDHGIKVQLMYGDEDYIRNWVEV
ncbi:hypothetical protein DOTSEDRAFT_24205 [Dothistroma septosporum NZE10]|uniref:Uncharacterized protein n=1 Tax=Dothistroma septosporum (strain NZE10 / CBS 128990) TaxID=675120 RepID=N1PKW0_DOTSN|nr:hypothetical protein DOTSEDRAFT_24205 [Dothistroma septosporum NZE10]